MLSQHTELGPEFLRSLPRLQAIGLTGAGAGLIDLQAMTEAGIRVTHAPLDDAALLARSLFRMLERTLNEQARERDESDPTRPDQGSRYRKLGTPVASLRPPATPGPATHTTALRLALVGSDDITARMLALAREAGYRCVGDDFVAAGTPDPGRHGAASFSSAFHISIFESYPSHNHTLHRYTFSPSNERLAVELLIDDFDGPRDSTLRYDPALLPAFRRHCGEGTD